MAKISPGENRSDCRNLWRKLLLRDGDKNLLSPPRHLWGANIFGTTVLRNRARRSRRRVFSSATYSCIRMSELQRVARNGAGANPPQLNMSTLPPAKRSNVV